MPASAATRTAVVVGAAGIAAGVGALTVGEAPTAPVVAAASVADHFDLQRHQQSVLRDHAEAAADRVSRSVARPPLLRVQRATKGAALTVSEQSLGGAMTESVAPPTPKEIAASLLSSYGWDSGQFSCLDALWTRESDWNPYAQNSSSGAYGIPQSLPATKMASAGADWATNAETQIEWGLGYISVSYGSPCGAWYFWESNNWY